MTQNTTTIEHIVLCLNNFEETIKFWDEFLTILGFKVILDKIYEDQHYISYNNGIIDIGLISPEKEFLNSKKNTFEVGLSHLALSVTSFEKLKECVEICKKYKVEIENEGDPKIHHLEEFKTLRFFCPSGLLIEVVNK